MFKKTKKNTKNLVMAGIGISTLGMVDNSAAPLGKAVKYGGTMIAGGMVLDSLGYLEKKTRFKK